MREPEFEDIQLALSTAPEVTKDLVSRRRFLQMSAVGVSLAMMPDWLQSASAYAAPLSPTDGILVVIQMGGGADGLNLVAPTGVGAYYDKRPTIAVKESDALPIAPGVGLNPAFVKLQKRFQAGDVAVIEGVSYPSPNLSHFQSIANWQSGWGPGGPPNDGWLGRYLDGMGNDPLTGISISSAVPLHMRGRSYASTTLPLSSANLFGAAANTDASLGRLCTGIESMNLVSTGLGTTADAIANIDKSSLMLASQVAPLYNPKLSGTNLVQEMELCARLINANLGTRVLAVSCGTFDTHGDENNMLASRLSEMDTAIETFFTTLKDTFADRVAVMTFSEFGRRIAENGGGGTDHGTSSNVFVIGKNVKGGLYGSQPSLTATDSNGNLKVETDFHAVYATVVDKWLKADSKQVLGKTYEDMGFFAASPGGVVATPPPNNTPPVPVVKPVVTDLLTPIIPPLGTDKGYLALTGAGAVLGYGPAATFGNGDPKARAVGAAATSDGSGYWIATAQGGVYALGSAQFHGGLADKPLNAPIVDIASSALGNGYWLLGADGGVFSFGDAAFYGSTGGMRLNQPVVGIASSPLGSGYWLVASDGGVFSFGPGAVFYGSAGSIKLNKPIVGIAATPSGKGYWMVASDGGVFAYGDAQFYGSTGSIKLNKPIVGIASSPSGQGYRLVASDGGVFCFGDAKFNGSAAQNDLGGQPVVAIL